MKNLKKLLINISKEAPHQSPKLYVKQVIKWALDIIKL